VSDARLYCKIDHIMVRTVGESAIIIGKKSASPEAVKYVHTSTRTNTGDSSCGRRLLTVDDVESLTQATEA